MLTEADLEERKKGIGGSEIAAVLGLDRFAGPLDVWLAKTAGWTKEVTPDMERGSFLEDGIANWYAHREGVKVHAVGPMVHRALPWARCTPDRTAVLRDGYALSNRLVSIKCPRWDRETPEGHILQLQWEDAVLCSAPAQAAALVPTMHLVSLADGDLKVVPVERDVELQRWMLDYAGAWWAKHVVGGVPPPLDGSEGASRWLKKRFPKNTAPERPATLDETVALLELREAEAARDEADKVFEAKAQKVKEAVGEAGGIESDAVGRATWKADKNGKRTFKTHWSKQ